MEEKAAMRIEPGLPERPAQRAMTRRQFLRLCTAVTAVLSLPLEQRSQIAHTISDAPRLPLIWLAFQNCAGDTESLLRSRRPGVADLLLDMVSLEYHSTLMIDSGETAEGSRTNTVANSPGRYLCVVEGSIPVQDGGVYCLIGGQTALSIAQEVCSSAWATIAIGSCAWDGGLPAAGRNATGAVGVAQAVPGLRNLLNMPGCPVNVTNLTAAIAYLLAFRRLPPTDGYGRPSFAYGQRVCHRCERRMYHHAGRYVRQWGDAAHRRGWCLKKMGCRGSATDHNCPIVGWNEGTSWPVHAGHGCIGCTQPHFWNQSEPFYEPTAQDDMGQGMSSGMGPMRGSGGMK
jgi:hydrogenase small subunit